MKKSMLCCAAVLSAGWIMAAAPVIALPVPSLTVTTSLRTSLEMRRSTRVFSDRALAPQEISNLLWAANGANRPDGHRTVPAAMGRYAITLYVALPDGIYVHNRAKNTLERKAAGDFRGTSDGRHMGSHAGMVVIMVANVAGGQNDMRKTGYIGVEAGAIAQNIYLYCAAANLNSVVCGSFDNAELRTALQLPADEEVFLTQVVGYPAQ